MKTILFLMTLFSATNLFAEEEIRNMSDMLSQVKLEKKQIELMVERLEKRGRLNQDEAVKVKREIASVKEEDLEFVKKEVLKKLDKN